MDPTDLGGRGSSSTSEAGLNWAAGPGDRSACGTTLWVVAVEESASISGVHFRDADENVLHEVLGNKTRQYR